MRISDWSSDVCSSDLLAREPAGTAHDALDLRHAVRAQVARAVGVALLVAEIDPASQLADDDHVDPVKQMLLDRRGAQHGSLRPHGAQGFVQHKSLAIGKAARRERYGQDGENAGGAVS